LQDLTSSFFIDSQVPVDKIRISVASDISFTGDTPGILIWSDIINNYIGIIGMNNYIDINGFTYSNQIEPSNGIEIFYPYKFQLTGNYNVRFDLLSLADNATVNTGGVDSFYILIEYYQS